ncbi:MAG: hypothetical protein HQL68_01285 [Magnetococcales bacterium]|nr:hypothetical protein [Magnetococcales bacterium]
MINFLASTGFLIAIVLSLYGWGRLFIHRLLPVSSLGWAYHASFGISIWIILGGVLNLLSIAKAPVLWGVLLLGLIFSVYHLFGRVKKIFIPALTLSRLLTFLAQIWNRPNQFGYGLLYFLLFTLVSFYIHTLMPTAIFNPYDDFGIYIPRVLQMVASGSLNTDNPFSSLPFDSLGGQAFMQGFFLLAFDIEYLNGFDLILCFILSVALIIELGNKFQISFKSLLLSLGVFIIWHPVSIDISSIYSTTLMILGATFSLMMWYGQSPFNPTIKTRIPFVFFISAMLTLKSTLFVYVALFLLFDLLLGLLFLPRRKPFVVVYTASLLMIIFLTAPWLLLFKEKISFILKSITTVGYQAFFALQKGSLGILLLFHDLQLFWGGRIYWFFLFFLLVAVVVSLALFLLWRRSSAARSQLDALPLISICLTASFFYFLSPLAFPWGNSTQHTVRHAMPGIMVVASLLPLLLHLIQHMASLQQPTKLFFSAFFFKENIVSSYHFVLLLFVGMFLVIFVDRIDQLKSNGSSLSYLSWSGQEDWIPNILSLNSKARKNEMVTIQGKASVGEKIIVWAGTPFHLDFSRNPIEVIVGFKTTWSRTLRDDGESMVESLRQRKVAYLLWQFGGFPMRYRESLLGDTKQSNNKQQRRGQLELLELLEKIRSLGSIVHLNEEHQLVLIKL